MKRQREGSDAEDTESTKCTKRGNDIYGTLFNKPFTNPFALATESNREKGFSRVNNSQKPENNSPEDSEFASTYPQHLQLDNDILSDPESVTQFPGEENEIELFNELNVILNKYVWVSENFSKETSATSESAQSMTSRGSGSKILHPTQSLVSNNCCSGANNFLELHDEENENGKEALHDGDSPNGRDLQSVGAALNESDALSRKPSPSAEVGLEEKVRKREEQEKEPETKQGKEQEQGKEEERNKKTGDLAATGLKDENLPYQKESKDSREAGKKTENISGGIWKVKRQGEGILRVLARKNVKGDALGESNSVAYEESKSEESEKRIIVRRRGTGALILNSPLWISSKFEEIAPDFSVRFAAYDEKKKLAGLSSPISVFSLRFQTQTSRAAFLATVRSPPDSKIKVANIVSMG